MKPITLLLTAALALAALPAFAQKATTKTPPKTKPPVATKAPAALTSVTGGVKKPGVADGKFTIGSGIKATKGDWAVDAGKATLADKAGKAVAIADLTPGSSVKVEGTIDAKAKTIAATKITVLSLFKKAVKAVPVVKGKTKAGGAPTPKAGSTTPKTGGN